MQLLVSPHHFPHHLGVRPGFLALYQSTACQSLSDVPRHSSILHQRAIRVLVFPHTVKYLGKQGGQTY